MLTKTNYAEWSAMMKVMLRPCGLWEAVNFVDVPEHEDMMAMEAICKSVPADMVVSMSNKESAKAAWDDIKTANLGVERVRKAKAQTLRREFDGLVFKDGESVDEFAVRINNLAARLRMLGDDHTEPTVVRRFLQALPPRYHQIAMSIETLLDLDEMSVEELVGRLKAAEERHGLSGVGNNGIAQLNLTEEELIARVSKKLLLSGGSSSSGNSGSSGSGGGRGGGRGRGGGCGRGSRKKCGDGAARGVDARGGGAVANDECKYCGNKGHWARECRKKKRDEAAHLA